MNMNTVVDAVVVVLCSTIVTIRTLQIAPESS